MMTARDICEQAAKDCGVLGLGQTLNSEDTNDAFIRLRNMMAQWQRKRWLVPSLYDLAMIGNSEKSNAIGPGQYWNVQRPDKIQAAYCIQLNTGSTPVSFPIYPIFSYEDYALISVKELATLPSRYFYDNAFPYGNVFIWPIPSAIYEIHLILKSPLGFSTTILTGAIIDDGAAYTDGVYAAVPLTTTGVGISATATITVAGGVVTTVAIVNGGEFFKIGDILSVAAVNVGGTGSGFEWEVYTVESNLDSVMELPEEYEEALIYNLSLRLSAMYQLEATQATMRLAKASLNTIRISNTQVPSLVMPASLRSRGYGFNIYSGY